MPNLLGSPVPSRGAACGTRDRSFLRALLRRDYLAHRPTILLQQITHLKRLPEQLFLVRFNYMGGPVEVDVIPWPSNDGPLASFPYDWIVRHHNRGSHAARSAGRLEVHITAFSGRIAAAPPSQR
ncbi:hypothetical protein C8R44DRAFT_893282 [Mycena epipterygia]|nr:hypothetical protein C8R44DRAFT_893282 [Mycena epipterygia]